MKEEGKEAKEEIVQDLPIDMNSQLFRVPDKIIIHVTDPKVISSGITQYVQYSIKVTTPDGNFSVIRRYKDFVYIRELLRERWPGCFIPPLPPKQSIGNTETPFIEERRRFLEEFLRRISAKPFLWNSEEVKIFYQSNTNDIEKTLKTVPVDTPAMLVNRYKDSFHFLSGKEINIEVQTKIKEFHDSLQKNKTNLNNFKEPSGKIAEKRSENNKLTHYMIGTIMPDCEKHILMAHLAKNESDMIFTKCKLNPQFNDGLNLLKKLSDANPPLLFHHLLKREHYDIEAYLEAFSSREHIEELKVKQQNKLRQETIEQQKVAASVDEKVGGFFGFNKVSKGDKLQMLDKTIKDLQSQVDSLMLLSDIITLVLGYIEIDEYRASKIRQYYIIMKEIANHEKAWLTSTMNVWKIISDISEEQIQRIEKQTTSKIAQEPEPHTEIDNHQEIQHENPTDYPNNNEDASEKLDEQIIITKK